MLASVGMSLVFNTPVHFDSIASVYKCFQRTQIRPD